MWIMGITCVHVCVMGTHVQLHKRDTVCFKGTCVQVLNRNVCECYTDTEIKCIMGTHVSYHNTDMGSLC